MLKELYSKYFTEFFLKLESLKSKKIIPTNPFLINIAKSDLHQTIPIMFFGQETNDWEGKLNLSIDELLDLYSGYYDITQEKPMGRSPFQRYPYDIYWSIKDKVNSDIALIWNNICKVGLFNEKGWHGDLIEELELEKFDIIADEIDIIKPKYLLFLTGDYEEIVFSRLPELEVKTEAQMFPYLKHIEYRGIPGIMTYHANPINFSGRKWEYIEYIVSDIIKHIV